VADGIEHERKFVVRDARFVDGLLASERLGTQIVQGYLVDRDGASVRVRLADDEGYLTFKGPRDGARRIEHEHPLPFELADALLEVCGGGVIRKIRFPVHDGDLEWSVDVFLDVNEGLVLAEVEDPPDDLAPPPWCGEEVTDDDRFYNLTLARAPFTTWPDRQRWQCT
jgi:CYTH domain-containing protein